LKILNASKIQAKEILDAPGINATKILDALKLWHSEELV
jgi:hypothetical protein